MKPLPSGVFARRLRAERERAELSQATLAARMAARLGSRVDPSAITRIEQQTRAVRLDEAVAAAEALNLPLVMLLVEDAEEETDLRLRQYLTELSLAEAEWARTRAEIDRLTTALRSLSDERARLAGARPHITPLDLRLAAAIDARIPLTEPDRDEEGQGRPRPTDRDA